MNLLRKGAVAILLVPTMLFFGLAYLLGALIRWINGREEPDEYEGPTMRAEHTKRGDWFWFY